MISKSPSKSKSKAKISGEINSKTKRKKSTLEVPQIKPTRKSKALQLALAVINNRKITDYFLVKTACDNKMETSGFESTASVLFLSAQDNENKLTNASTLQLNDDCSMVTGHCSSPKGSKQPVTSVTKAQGEATSMTQEWVEFHGSHMSVEEVGMKEVIVTKTAEPEVGHSISLNASMDVEDDEESWEHFHQYNVQPDDCKLCRSRSL